MKIFRSTEIFPSPSALFPILDNSSFRLGLEDPHFWALINAYVFRAHYVLGDIWPSMGQLHITYIPSYVHNLDFYWKAQLLNFLTSLPPAKAFTQDFTSLEQGFISSTPLRYLVSLMYNLIIAHPRDFKPPYLLKWEKDLQMTLWTEQTNKILFFTHQASIYTKHQKTNFKILTR